MHPRLARLGATPDFHHGRLTHGRSFGAIDDEDIARHGRIVQPQPKLLWKGLEE
jgi:hypothetical protein